MRLVRGYSGKASEVSGEQRVLLDAVIHTYYSKVFVKAGVDRSEL